MKDWVGNTNSIFKTIGASNHTEKERESNDYYATEPKAVSLLMEVEEFTGPIWECACGEGHLSEELKKRYEVYSSDLIDRGYGIKFDFFKETKWDGDIVTNPPYKFGLEFIEHAINIIPEGNKVAMFMKVQFLEGQKRGKFFKKYPPKVIYVSSSRLLCAMNGEFKDYPSSAIAYAWYVWEKGYFGNTIVKWIN